MIGQLTFSGMPPKPREDLSQWFTPRPLAEKIVKWAGDGSRAGLAGLGVLEPSAGSGAFVGPLLAEGAMVHAVEVDPQWARHLRLQFASSNLEVACYDFMTWRPDRRFDLAIANPPYEDDQDLYHLLLASSYCDRVVALVRANFKHGVARYERLWSSHALLREVILTRRPHFSGVGSPRHDFIVIEVRRGGTTDQVQTEFWL